MNKEMFSKPEKVCSLLMVIALFYLCDIQAQSWYATAEQRIDTLRKGDFTLHITDTAGNPVTDSVYIRLKKHEFPWGNTVDKPENSSVSRWKQAVLQKYYNYGVVEAFKWPYIEGTKGYPYYTNVDSVYAWARRVGWDVRAHTLLWGGSNSWQMPGWTLSLTGKTLYDECEKHIRREVTRYKGTIKEYDVLNEPIHETWLATNAGDSINWNCFKWADETDSTARLFVNEFNIIVWGSAADYISKIRQMLDHGAPIDGIGVQGHMEGNLNWSDIKGKFDLVAALGLPIKVTEFDMKIKEQNISDKNMASAYGMMMRICFSHPAVEGLIWWGFWEPTWREGSGIFTQEKTPKMAADTVFNLIHKKWTTDIKVKPEADGSVTFRGFYGDYIIGIKDGEDYKVVTAACRKASKGGDIAVSLDEGVAEPPVLLNIGHNADGSKVCLHFDKEMQDPVAMVKNFLIFSNNEVTISSAALDTSDKHTVELSLASNIAYGRYYSVVYTPGRLKAANGGVLAVTGPETIVNKMPAFVSAQTTPEGYALEISISHPMEDPAGSLDSFAVTVNGTDVAITEIGLKEGVDSIIVLMLAIPVASTSDIIRVSYTRGTLSSTEGFLLESFSLKLVQNKFSSLISNPYLNQVKVYPNPFTGELVVEQSSASWVDEIRLHDVAGREIQRIPAENQTFITIHTAGIVKGFYTLQLMKNGEIVDVRKVTKE